MGVLFGYMALHPSKGAHVDAGDSLPRCGFCAGIFCANQWEAVEIDRKSVTQIHGFSCRTRDCQGNIAERSEQEVIGWRKMHPTASLEA